MFKFLSLSSTITVNSNVTPQFEQVASICSGATLNALPTTSINGVSGTWAPPINNAETTTYTFTPTIQGACISNAVMTIGVLSITVPTFPNSSYMRRFITRSVATYFSKWDCGHLGSSSK
ncbi:MAG: hypothetical protein IPP30_05645 [Flavobacterium sp.]|nr:hypothetical protein [Flavobacterium sp.]